MGYDYVISTTLVIILGVRRSGPELSAPAAAGIAPVGVVPQPYLYEPSLTSIQLRQASVAELKKNDAYWEKRMHELESKHKKMYEIMEIEYNKAVSICYYYGAYHVKLNNRMTNSVFIFCFFYRKKSCSHRR